MKKVYLKTFNDSVKDQSGNILSEGIILTLDESEITKKLDLAGIAYTTDLDNICEYDIFDADSNVSLWQSKSDEYMFTLAENLTLMEQTYIIDKEIHDGLQNDMIEEYGDITSEEMEKILMRGLKQIFTNEQWKPNQYKAYDFWDGSNWQEIILEHEYYDSGFLDYTEELGDMSIIDKYKGSTYIETLYETKEGEKLLVNSSFYQDHLNEFKWVNRDIETISELE